MKRNILILLIATTLFGGLFVFRANAYEIGTHAFLTKEIIDFYNKHFPNKPLSEDLADYLIDGSRREDNVPRYFHHFYDPVNDRGLADDIYRGQKSKDWAQSEKLQKRLVYKMTPATVASILTASQIDKIKPVFNASNFTWKKAIDLYARGETEQALFALGHIMHLLEDASVPDHTRNDAHPPYDDGGSPYENWTKKFDLENPDKDLANGLKNKKPISLSDLNSYFDEMARYSNNNFYSRDSINKYKLPKPDYFEASGKYFYGFRKDNDGLYKLAVYTDNPEIDWKFESKPILNDKQGNLVLVDYWSRLSTKSVQYSAGVINLFFQEAEKAKAKYALEKAQRPLLARLLDGFGGIFGGKSGGIDDVVELAKRGNNNFELAAEIPLANQSEDTNLSESANNKTSKQPEIPIEIVSMQLQSVEPIKTTPSKQKNNQSLDTESSEADDEYAGDFISRDPEPTLPSAGGGDVSATEIVSLQLCGFNTSQTPIRQGVVINEIAWMGSLTSANDEWFELKNISGAEMDVTGWQILDKAEQIKVQLSGKISAGGFYLLERNSDAVVPGISADFIYQASGNGAPSLNNTDESLRLFDKNCNLADEVFANPNWPAGESSTRRTMERSPDFSWHTYLGNGENGILGTPRKENSPPPSAYNYSSGGGGGAQNNSAQSNQNPQENAPAPAKLLITEIQINPTSNRFIELYNPNDFPVDLTGWYLQRKTQTGGSFSSLVSNTYFNGKTINARGYFMISRNALDGADIVLDNLTLTESNTIQFKNPNAEVVDRVGWGQAGDCEGGCASQLPDNQSIQRKFQNEIFVDTDNNATDFEIQNCPSPKAQSGSCQSAQSNQAPSAFFDYTSKGPKVGDLITFNAASSTDPDGSIAFYQWDFGDGATTTLAQSTIAHTYFAAGDYLAQLIVVDNQNASSTATSTAISVSFAAISNINVSHAVISEIQIAGIDAGDEFIELYNPTDGEVDLSGWSIQYLSGNASSTANVSKKNFDSGNKISARGFFLIARNKNAGGSDGYGGGKIPDLGHRTFSMSGASSGAKIFLVNNQETISDFDDANMVDKLNYSFSVPPAGQSLERKAYQNNSCVTAQNSGEYLGNGCDTDNDQNDFEPRLAPNPQNSQSLPEPRSAPAAVQNFNAVYSSSIPGMIFNWNMETGLSYQIADVSGGVSPVILNQATTTGSTNKINEIGREYIYEIVARDAEGLSSSAAQTTINAPSFINSLSFYRDPRPLAASDYVLEFDWQNYPFVPIKFRHLSSGQEVPNNWQVVVFYYNQEPQISDDIFWIDPNGNAVYKNWGLIAPGGLKVKYPNCFGGDFRTTGAALILPNDSEQCSADAGNHASYALNWNQLEDNHLLLEVANDNFATSTPTANQDYVTLAFYAYQPGYEPNNYGIKLAAIDKTKYYFQDEIPTHQPPTSPDGLDFDFDDTAFLLNIIWDQATDADTLDNLISYLVDFVGNSTSTAANSIKIPVEPNVTYDFEFRAKDDFGNLSDATGESYTVPDVPLPYGLTDVSWGRLDNSDSVSLSMEFNEYPFMDIGAPSAMIFFLNQLPPANYSFLDDDYRNGANMGGSNNFLKLSYYPCDFNGAWTEKRTVGGAIFNNADCPVNSSLAMSKLLLAKLGGEDTRFAADAVNDQEFSENDYITIGFYRLGLPDRNGRAYFTNAANYNKKIYFQP